MNAVKTPTHITKKTKRRIRYMPREGMKISRRITFLSNRRNIFRGWQREAVCKRNLVRQWAGEIGPPQSPAEKSKAMLTAMLLLATIK